MFGRVHVPAMTLRDAFPRTSAAYPGLMDWDLAFDWDHASGQDFALQIIDHQIAMRAAGEAVFLAYCDSVADDVGGIVGPEEDSTSADTIDAFRILFATAPMWLTLSWGRAGECYGWIMWCLARGCDRHGRVFDVQWRFMPPRWRAAREFQHHVHAGLGTWAQSFFLCARKFGGLDDVARHLADHCFRLCSDQFKRQESEEENFAALVAMANWAANANEPQAEAWVHFVSGYWVGNLSPRSRAELGVLLMTSAHRFTLKDAQWWANLLLERWRHVLTEHVEVQVYATSLRTIDDWTTRRDLILDAIARLGRSYSALADDRQSALQSLESRVNILHPLIHFLTENGTSVDVLDVLGAWYVESGRRECDGDVLVIAAGHPPGPRYLWPGGMLQIEHGNGADTYNRVLETASTALREYYRATDVGDRIPDMDTSRMGIPDEAASKPFEEAVRALYRPDLLAEALPKNVPIRSVLTIPGTPVPLSAMLAIDAGISVAAEASLRSSLPERPIRQVSVWLGSMMHGQFELDALRRCADLAGWTVTQHGGDQDDLDAFRSFYGDEDADVLWVIGHGEHSPYRMDETGLRIGEDRLLSAAELRALPVPGDVSRLLVLNVCSGATTQLLGGIARMGLSQELVAPNQQVLAHLWPIGVFAGLAFGAKFGWELTRCDRTAAYGATVRGMHDPRALRAELLAALGDDLEIHRRLEGQDDQVGGVLSWGAPVLLT